MEKGAQFSYQLNVLLPMILHTLNLPLVPGGLLGQLNGLRTIRNQIAHSGRPKNELNKTQVTMYVCASIFALKFIEIIEPMIVLD